MTYTSDIPVTGDSLGSTRDRIRVNFQQISSLIGTNHVAFGGILGQGKHKFLQIPEINTQTPSTIPATAANEAAFYSKVGTNPAETNLFFRGESNGFEYQLTKAISGSTGTFATGLAYPPNGATEQGGWTFLPGGLILQYGKKTSPGSSGTINFPIAFPSGTVPFSIQVSLQRSSGNQTVTIDSGTPPTASAFDYLASSGGSNSVNWIAIGN